MLGRFGIGAAVVFAALQAVPYGWEHSNPPVIRDAPWPDDASASIARTSCYSCHSNETDWPFYSYVAPMSWLVRFDVERGRGELNFSEWDDDADEAEDAVSMVERGKMPLDRYTWIHRDATLSASERDTLIRALEQMARATTSRLTTPATGRTTEHRRDGRAIASLGRRCPTSGHVAVMPPSMTNSLPVQ